MNVYDFDKTIYDGDSTIDFWKFCMIRYPRCRRYILHAILSYLKFYLRLCSREKFKREFYAINVCMTIIIAESIAWFYKAMGHRLVAHMQNWKYDKGI